MNLISLHGKIKRMKRGYIFVSKKDGGFINQNLKAFTTIDKKRCRFSSSIVSLLILHSTKLF